MKNFEIVNKANVVDVFFFGTIGSEILAKDFVDEMNAIDKKLPVMMYLFSGGGSVYDAVVIRDYIQTRGSVDCTITGICASAASYLITGCDRVYMTNDSRLMIHNASGGSWGEAKDQELLAKELRAATEKIAQAYAERTRLPLDQIQAMMNETTWLDASKAKELGFIDEIVKGGKVAASIGNLSKQEINTEWSNFMDKKESKIAEIQDKVLAFAKTFAEDFILCNNEEKEESIIEDEVKVGGNVDEEAKVEEQAQSFTVEDVENMIDEKTKDLVNQIKEIEESLTKKTDELLESKIKNYIDVVNKYSGVIEEVKEAILSNQTDVKETETKPEIKKYELV